MPLDQNELETLAARFVLGEVEAHEIRELADKLLTDGEDDPVLIEIYIDRSHASKEELAPNFKKFLEQRVALPKEDNAATDLAYRYAKRATIGLIDFEDAVISIGSLYKSFQWNGLRLDLDEIRWVSIGARPLSLSQGLCERLVTDFEADQMRRWIPKPPVLRKGILGFLDRLHS